MSAVCPHSGVSIPECGCRACNAKQLRAQLEHHALCEHGVYGDCALCQAQPLWRSSIDDEPLIERSMKHGH